MSFVIMSLTVLVQEKQRPSPQCMESGGDFLFPLAVLCKAPDWKNVTAFAWEERSFYVLKFRVS